MAVRPPPPAAYLCAILVSGAAAGEEIRIELWSGHPAARVESAALLAGGLRLTARHGKLQTSQSEAPPPVSFEPGTRLDGHPIAGKLTLWADGDGISAVESVDLEEYVASVVSAEVPSGWPKAALEAQAVAARTFAMAQKVARGPSSRFHLRASVLDHIAVLREYCARQKESPALIAIGDILRSLRFLPATATLEQFLADTKKIFAELKWEHRWSVLTPFVQGWSAQLSVEFSRAIYLRWLKETLDSFTIARAPKANHIYSRVHLLTYAEAEGQEWSHLILAGLNQGEWPQAEHESGFLSDNQIAELNKRATRRGDE